MTEQEMNREELEHQALEALGAQEAQSEYVERPRSHRILAWILVVIMAVGVLLYYGWISGIIHT